MKREIKFRGMTISGKWQYGLLASTEQGTFISNSVGRPLAYQVNPQSVGQYTGLKDKNNKYIYEGDIVSNGLNNGEVKYKSGCFMWFNEPLGFDGDADGYTDNSPEKWGEVLGNIYQNPELL